MAKWIPGAALFGLVCLMMLPAPGIWGVLIGGICALAIVVSAVMWVLDRMAGHIVNWREAANAKRLSAQRRRAVHAGSGMARMV